MARDKKRAIIIGAGPGGLTAALALRRAGIAPIVYERATELKEIGSGLTLWPNAISALEKIGLAEAVKSVSLPTSGIAMKSWEGHRLFFVQQKVSTLSPVYGVAIHRVELQRVLSEALGESAVVTGAKCIGFCQDESRVFARFEDGSEEPADILIGADGIRSTIRAELFGPNPLEFAGYCVWRGVTKFDLDEMVGLTTIGRGAQFGLFPMPEGRVYWFASVVADEDEKDWPVGRKRELLERFGDWHSPIRAVIEATKEEEILRNNIYDQKPRKTWSKGRVSLLGDAAHPTTPGLGQGACQAIEDGVVLAECLGHIAEVPRALRKYEARRIPRTRAITLQSRRMGQMGKWKNPVLCWLRDAMIKSTPASLMHHQLTRVFSFE